ncbi:MAG: DUF3999 domain-containing protein [Treponema sp.]|jgi:hypothetical protein|nr:DUF3999 domain-containing protein [Treponema sp.]
MKRKKRPVLFPLLLFLLGFNRALFGQDTKVPVPGDFAGSLVLTGAQGVLLGLELPEAVYQGIERPDMGDIRVFDRAGLLVPFVIRPAPAITLNPPPENVPFFPWGQENDAALPSGTDIVIDAEGAVVNIKSRGGRPSADPAYILDLSGFSATPSSLHITLGKEGEFYNTTVRIYSSADLARWPEYQNRQTLAWFGGGVGRDTLELPRGNYRYLLLKFDRPNLPPRNITAFFETIEIPPPAREKTIAGEWRGNDRRIAGYAAGGFYPLTAIEFPLPEADSIEVRIKNRFTGESEWSFVTRTNLFRISNSGGEILTSKALNINTSAPFWELEAAGDLAFSSLPGCVIRWAVYELVFLGRGEGPWTLAWGNGDYGPQGEGDMKLPGLTGGAGGPEIETARPLGEPTYTPGPRTAPSWFSGNWGQFILWAILILAAAFLSGLALYIAKGMKKERT